MADETNEVTGGLTADKPFVKPALTADEPVVMPQDLKKRPGPSGG